MFTVSINFVDGKFLEFECDQFKLVNGAIACEFAKDEHTAIFPIHDVRKITVRNQDDNGQPIPVVI